MQKKINKVFPKTWVEISASHLLSNLKLFRKVAGPKVKIAAVVKANAYGHGLTEVVSILKKKVDVFAVDTIEDALFIRQEDKKVTILVLGYVRKENISLLIRNAISFVAYRPDILKHIINLNLSKKAKIHIKVETGLNRQGVRGEELVKVLDFITKHQSKFILEGVYMHFANVEDTTDPSFAMKQLASFNESLGLIKSKGFTPPLIHSAASAAALLHKKSHFSMIRTGIGLYGLWPSPETKKSVLKKDKKNILKPVLSWKTTIAQIKMIKKGESVSYGRTWIAKNDTKIAIVPVGYSDGLDRGLSNKGKVIVGGGFAPIIGRVAMNMIMVDVTKINKISPDSEVIIIGEKGKLKISAEDIAEKIDTINYEVVSRINPILPRIIK
jgi:alanine racemase